MHQFSRCSTSEAIRGHSIDTATQTDDDQKVAACTCSAGGRGSSLLFMLLLREMEPVLPTDARLLSACPSDLCSVLIFNFLGDPAQFALLLGLNSMLPAHMHRLSTD